MKDKLRNILKNSGDRRYARSIKENTELYRDLLSITSFLPETSSIPERVYVVLNDIDATCPNGKIPVFHNIKEGYRKYCGTGGSCKCRSENHSKVMKEQAAVLSEEEKQKRRTNYHQTMIERHGVKNPMHSEAIRSKQEKTCVDRYNARTPLASEEIQEKIQQSNLEKLGVRFPLQSSEIRKKSQDTTNERYNGLMTHARDAAYEKYNGRNPFQVKEVQDKIKETNKNKYKRGHHKQNHISDYAYDILCDEKSFKETADRKTLYEIAKILDIDATTVRRYAAKYGVQDIIGSELRSKEESQLAEVLTEHGISFISGNRSLIKPYEIDIFIPSINTGIELNGLMYHSEMLFGNPNKNKNYHMIKHRLARDKGISLYQFFDDEWRDKKDLIIDKILYLCGKREYSVIGARKLKIDKIDNFLDESNFLNKFHIQGSSSNRTSSFGGYVDNTLVCLMCVKITGDIMDITRYATNSMYSIPGGFTKLMKYIIDFYQFKGTIISFSDNNHSMGDLYKNNGFTIDRKIPPDYYLTDTCKRFRKEMFRKDKIKKHYPQVFDSSKTEHEMTLELGFYRIYDSGKIKWSRSV